MPPAEVHGKGVNMAKNNQDTLARAYAMLSSLRKNIGSMKEYSILETYANEFHAVLDRLEGTGIDVSEFCIPDSEVNSKVTAVGPTSYGGGGGESHVSYSKEKYVDKSFILTKLDAILGYFEIITSEKPKSIGFHTPANQ